MIFTEFVHVAEEESDPLEDKLGDDSHTSLSLHDQRTRERSARCHGRTGAHRGGAGGVAGMGDDGMRDDGEMTGGPVGV